MRRNNTLYLVLIPFILIMAGCAGQVYPSGGPVDTDPPYVVKTEPGNGTLNFSAGEIVFQFSEYVDKRSVEEAVFISPAIKNVEFDWSGKEVAISWTDSLRKNTTYVINLGTDVRDINNQNRMKEAYTLAFSTGDNIAKGSIAGRVFDAGGVSAAGMMIFAYVLDGINPDTLNPANHSPDFITQTGTDGSFELRYLPFAKFRIIGVKDEYRNLLYDPETDRYAVGTKDFTLTPSDTSVSELLFYPSVEDTSGPRLLKAVQMDSTIIIAEFSEDLKLETVTTDAFAIRDTVTNEETKVVSVILQTPARHAILLRTTPLPEEAVPELHVRHVSDSAGNLVSQLANRVLVSRPEQFDSLRLSFSYVSIADSARDVDTEPDIVVAANLPPSGPALDITCELIDAAGNRVPVTRTRIHASAVQMRPVSPLRSEKWYTAIAQIVTDGDTLGKTVVFRTVDEEMFSAVDGEIEDTASSNTMGNLFVVARYMKDGQAIETKRQADSLRRFEFKKLPEGKYIFWAFKDRNGNGIFDPGHVYPFIPSEPFVVQPDTLSLRARWPLEGLKIRLK